jgi:hypothetical protein
MQDMEKKTLSLKSNRIVFQHGDIFTFFDLKLKLVTLVTLRHAHQLAEKDDTFYVIAGSSSMPFSSKCVNLFISSPRATYIKNFIKENKSREWVFPIWSFDELERCHHQCYQTLNITLLNERYRVYGGIPRSLFHNSEIPLLAKMDKVLNDPEAAKGVKHVGLMTDIYPESHTLLHIVVGDDIYGTPYQDIGLKYASRYVATKMWELHKSQMITLLNNDPARYSLLISRS